MDFFWTNTIWYLLLGLVTIIEVIFVIVKVKHRKFVFAFYMTVTGMALIFETIIKIIFKAYLYYPKIILSSPYDDSLAGNLFSQFSVGATALVVAVFQLDSFWYFLLAVIYGCIEELFIAMGIFSHNWYKTWMTIVSLLLFFWWAKKLFILLQKKSFAYYLSVFSGLFTLDVVTLLWGLILSGYQDYSREYFSDPFTSRYISAVLYFIFVAVSSMVIYFFKLSWKWKTIVILALYCVNYISYKLQIFLIKDGWFLICSTTTIFWIYLSVILMDYLFKNTKYFDHH